MLVVKGSGSSGKSTTLKLAFESYLQYLVRLNDGVPVEYLYLTKREVAAVIKLGKLRVGLATRGDSQNQVKLGLSFFAAHKCRLVVCATRSRGKPLKVAQDFSLQKLKVQAEEWKKPKDVGSKNQQVANHAFAKEVAGWLQSASRGNA
ncbi:hypothetical protein [Piscinibacter gummiphilus]|uniref:Uncharacterized protein n=1 Tax=Piscinibacter gummiphilus TaxID=946333 RepID=A0ABZ0CVI6_9BURK|nr:hypothetical protein [Piscinibacter gummiphilus]WOB06883.1 hypothetical protein RXV79_18395 [Piscinibacter gummiphilus]